LDEFGVPPAEVLSLVSRDLAVSFGIVPISHVPGRLVIAIADPENTAGVSAARELTGLEVEVCVASPRAIRDAIARYYSTE
jgi:hypothetical protein